MHVRISRRRADTRQTPHGFTLIELLVAVGIFLVLTVITLVSVNLTLSGDRIKGTARQVQSYLAGARDRAIYAKAARGVRLLLDPNNGHQAVGMIYIGTPSQFSDELVTFENDDTGQTIMLLDTTRPWRTLSNQGFLGVGARIQIPKDTGAWYRVASRPFGVTVSGNTFDTIVLDRPCTDLGGSSARLEYTLELKAGVLPGAEPVSFPLGVVIDLDGSQLPDNWRPATFGGSYSGTMDILFSPRGDVIGNAALLGQLHLLVADLGDSEKWAQISGRSSGAYNSLPFVPANDPGTPDTLTVENDQILVTVSTRTGRVTSHPVNVTNTNAPTGLKADDPYAFAELGEVISP